MYHIFMANETIEIQGVVFDIPTKDSIPKWDYKEWKDGKDKCRSMWLDTYERDSKGIGIHSYQFTSVNGSKFFMDEKKLRGEDVEKAKRLFRGLDGK